MASAVEKRSAMLSAGAAYCGSGAVLGVADDRSGGGGRWASAWCEGASDGERRAGTLFAGGGRKRRASCHTVLTAPRRQALRDRIFFLFHSNLQPRLPIRRWRSRRQAPTRPPSLRRGGRALDDDDDWERHSAAASATARAAWARRREKRRRRRVRAQRAQCGKCRFCKDMPKFGGTGGTRQVCERRKCTVMREEEEEEAVKRAAERAERREASARCGRRSAAAARGEGDGARSAATRAARARASAGATRAARPSWAKGGRRAWSSRRGLAAAGRARRANRGGRPRGVDEGGGLASVAYLATLVEPPGADGDGDAGRSTASCAARARRRAPPPPTRRRRCTCGTTSCCPTARRTTRRNGCGVVPAGDAAAAAADAVRLPRARRRRRHRRAHYDDGWWEVKVEAVVPAPRGGAGRGAPCGAADAGSHHFRVVDDVRQVAHRPRRCSARSGCGRRRHARGGTSSTPATAASPRAWPPSGSRRIPPAQQVGVRGAVSQRSCYDSPSLQQPGKVQSVARRNFTCFTRRSGRRGRVRPVARAAAAARVATARWPGCFSSNKALKSFCGKQRSAGSCG